MTRRAGIIQGLATAFLICCLALDKAMVVDGNCPVSASPMTAVLVKATIVDGNNPASAPPMTAASSSDIEDVLQVTMHTYGYANFRKFAKWKDNDLQDTNFILNDQTSPIDVTQLIAFAKKNKEASLKLNETTSTHLFSSFLLSHCWFLWGNNWQQHTSFIVLIVPVHTFARFWLHNILFVRDLPTQTALL